MDTIDQHIDQKYPNVDAEYRAHLRAGCEGWNLYVDAYPKLAVDPALQGKYVLFHGGRVYGTYDDFAGAAEDVGTQVGTNDGVVITKVGEEKPVKF